MLIFICVTLWRSPESNFTMIDEDTFLYNKFENCILKITASSLRGQWVNNFRFCYIHLSTISQWMTKTLFGVISLKIAFLKLWIHLSGANELTVLPYSTSVAFYQHIDPCSCQCHYLIPLQSSFTFSLISWFIDFDGNHLKVSNAIAKKGYSIIAKMCVFWCINVKEMQLLCVS